MQMNVQQLSNVTQENFSPMETTVETMVAAPEAVGKKEAEEEEEEEVTVEEEEEEVTEEEEEVTVEVHLTELLPVKQSAIRCNENPEEKEGEMVTDAFKALREVNKQFSIERSENFESNVLGEEYAGNCGTKEPVNKKRTVKRRNDSLKLKESNRSIEKRTRYTVRQKEPEEGKLPMQEKNNGERKQALRSARKSAYLARAKEFERSKFQQRVSPVVEDSKMDGNEDPMGRTGVLIDEIYVFRLEKSVDDRGGDKSKALDSNEESLREKIDAIIQANYVIEGKNNNTTRENRNRTNGGASDCSETELRNSSDDSTDKKHRCVICEARFKGSGGLRTHYKVVHAAGPMYTCNECGKGFPLKERLKLHVRTHTGYKPYKCSECEKSFARGGQLVQHRRTHTQVKPYHCVLCPGTFSCAANLALHVKRHNGQKDHKCDICGRAFVRRDALKKHLECLHKDVKSFLCVICNKTFKGHLPQHMRTHAQDRPHGCATCGQRFAQKSQLTVHQRTHSGQRPFRCLVCWKAFAHSTALKLHTRRHTGERPFKCAECSAGFTQLPHWKKHMRCVHGRTDPYCCKSCNTFFRIKNDLETHEKSCNSGEPVVQDNEGENRGRPVVPKYRIMTVEKMRLLLAVLFKRISKPERLDELGFGKRLIDEVLKDSLVFAGKDPAEGNGCNEFETLKQNLTTFLEWTVPTEHWEALKKLKKSPEEILETLTVNQ